MRPHDTDPSVFFSGTPPFEHRTSTKPGAAIWRGVGLDSLLAEPESPRDQIWLPLLCARLAAVSAGPLLCAGESDRSARLELARIPRVAVEEATDLDAARTAFWPCLEELKREALGAGSPAPSLVLVGERDPYERIPFLSKSGFWLWRSLRMLGYDELSTYATNALDFRKHPRTKSLNRIYELFARYEPTWCAVGRVASEVLSSAGVPHVRLPHPSAHRKFKFNSGPEGYAVLLKEAGLETGPWLDKALPCTPGGPDGLVEHYGLPRSTAYRTGDKKMDPNGGSSLVIEPELLERARRIYIIGEAKTPLAAARQVTDKKSKQHGISRAARLGKWEVERADHLAHLREETKAQAVMKEAKATSDARRMAWDGVTKALGRYITALDNPATLVRAQDVKAIGDFALSLSDRGDTKGDAERDSLGSLPLPELAKRLSEAADAFTGRTVEKTIGPEETPK